jgi:dolichol kinase
MRIGGSGLAGLLALPRVSAVRAGLGRAVRAVTVVLVMIVPAGAGGASVIGSKPGRRTPEPTDGAGPTLDGSAAGTSASELAHATIDDAAAHTATTAAKSLALI